MSRVKLTTEEKEALYKAEIARREREEPQKKLLGVIKKKVKLTEAEKKELVAREIHRREEILKARAAKARAENGARKKGKPGIVVAAALLIVAGAFMTFRDSSVHELESVPVRSVESATVEDVSLPVESAAVKDAVPQEEISSAPTSVLTATESGYFDYIDESPVDLVEPNLKLSPTESPTATPVPTIVPTPKPSSTPRPTPTPRPDVTLTVSKDYAFEGKTSYALSTREYYELMDRLRQYVSEKVNLMTKTGGTDYPHFESVSVSKDCSVYTVVVNDANSRTPAEQEAPDRFKEYAEMYAAFNKSKVTDASVEYVTMNGNLLSKVGLVATSTVLALSENSFSSESSVTRNTTEASPVMTPTPQAVPSYSYDVWIPASGSKYHSIPNCGKMNPNKASLVSVEWAESHGYSACSKCW